jgi:Ser/Thr protein kinase RdoA (MazF antagonist)
METIAEKLPTVELSNAVLDGARKAYGLGAEVKIEWLGQSENTTYLVKFPHGTKTILRVGRLNYHSYESLLSEVAWLKHLKTTTDLVTPEVIPGKDGEGVQRLIHPLTGAERLCVMFSFVTGKNPDNLSRERFIEQFETLGELTAILHQNVINWPESKALPRETWDLEDLVGENARLVTWEESPYLTSDDRSVIKKAIKLVESRLDRYGKADDRYGLIHADLRCSNLLVDGNRTALIDFDDAAFGYFMYDFGAAVTFIEDHPDLRLLLDAWLKGYQQLRTLSAEDIDEIKTFVLLRRIAIHGWVISHWEADDVRNGLGINHDRVTVDLAQRYLRACANDQLIW